MCLHKGSSITTRTEMSFWGADHISPTFPELFVTKPVVIQGTKRYLPNESYGQDLSTNTQLRLTVGQVV